VGSGNDNSLSVTVTLATPPVWYEPDYWNTHEFDSFDSSGPYADKPKITVSAKHQETLAEVIDRAADELGLRLGPAHEKYLRSRVSDWLARMGFYRPQDDASFDGPRMYEWPFLLKIARDTGVVEEVAWRDVTYRELIASSTLGLVEGDVLRPYICLSHPQGVGPAEIAEGVRVTLEAIRHAYAALPDTRNPVDDILRISGLATTANALSGGVAKLKRRRADKKRLKSATRAAGVLGYMLTVETYDWKAPEDSFRYYAEAAPFVGSPEPIFLGNGMTPGFAAQCGIKMLRAHIEEEAETKAEDTEEPAGQG
jgi:hypothetical protein